jgi:hypothetical protein
VGALNEVSPKPRFFTPFRRNPAFKAKPRFFLLYLLEIKTRTPGFLGKTPLSIGETPFFLGETPFFLGETPVFLGETPVFLGETPVFFGETPVFLGETPVFFGETPGFFGETPVSILGGGPLNPPLCIVKQARAGSSYGRRLEFAHTAF